VTVKVYHPGTETELILGPNGDYTIGNYPDGGFTAAGAHPITIFPIGNYKAAVGSSFTADFVIMRIKVTLANLKPGSLPASADYLTQDGVYANLPEPGDAGAPAAAGYTFAGWYYDGSLVTNGTGVKSYADHELTAVWTLNPFTAESSGDIDAEFDGKAHSIAVTLSCGVDVEYTYMLERMADGRILVGETKLTDTNRILQSFTNVSDSGYYRLTVTAADADKLTCVRTVVIRFEIKRKTLNSENVDVNSPNLNPGGEGGDPDGGLAVFMPAVAYDGKGHSPEATLWIGSTMLKLGEDYKLASAGEYTKVGKYAVEFELIGNYEGRFKADFEITKNASVLPAWLIWLIVVIAAAVMAGTLWSIWAYVQYKRRKYGMKRHVDTFLDYFGKDGAIERGDDVPPDGA
jgi:uncharacterized repeat protein (TIGR02543 family)